MPPFILKTTIIAVRELSNNDTRTTVACNDIKTITSLLYMAVLSPLPWHRSANLRNKIAGKPEEPREKVIKSGLLLELENI